MNERLAFAREMEKFKPTPRLGRVEIGQDCYIGAGTIIGDHGFGRAWEDDGTPVVIWHGGGVKIGNRCVIGNNCCIDRATLPENDTILEDDVHLDNLVHIAHNCVIGAKTCIAAGSILAGSVRVGESCWIGVHATISDHVTLADHTFVGAGAMVLRDTEPWDMVVGNPARFLRKRNPDEY